MASFNKERLLRLIVTLDIDERSRQRLEHLVNRVQNRWSDAAKARHANQIQMGIDEARMAAKVRNQHRKDEQALNAQRSREYVASQTRRILYEDNERARVDREANKAKRLQEQAERRDQRKQVSARDALNNQRSRAYVRQQEQAQRWLHRMRADHIREEGRQRHRQQQAEAALERQRSRAYLRSQEVRHRAEMRNLRDRDREERKILRRGQRHLRIGALATGAAAAGGFYAFQHVLNERGREAIQLRGTSDALGIPLDDLQQLVYVARIMGLWFGPAELADAQNKMIEIQRDMRRYKEGDLPGSKLRIGARKLVEYGVDPEEATMANMLPIIELMAQGWLKGDREVMAALNNMFEEQVGKRVGVISTMMATGEWRNLLAADLLTAEEIEDVSRMYRQMILVMHEADVAMQRFLVGNKENVDTFITDLRTIVHTTGEMLNKFGFLGHIMGNIVPILVGISAAMAALTLKIWGTAWAAAALSAASGQWHNLAMFAAVGAAAGIFTRLALDKLEKSAEVEPPATKTGQLQTVEAIKEANKKIEGDLSNILCIARNAEASAEDALDAATGKGKDAPSPEVLNKWFGPLYDMTKPKPSDPRRAFQYMPGFERPPMAQSYDREEFTRGLLDWRLKNLPRSADITAEFESLRKWQRENAPKNTIEIPEFMDDYITGGIFKDVRRFDYERGSNTPIEVNGDLNINVETVTDIDDAVRETDKYLKNNE